VTHCERDNFLRNESCDWRRNLAQLPYKGVSHKKAKQGRIH